ncbi:MAG: DNA adenine methylase [Deltaproteobacteria bacterium]|nr:DNA adenine methylase [Deltaproteobacteria bacterium]
MQYFSPLRYPGGKGKLAPFLKEVFSYNNLCDGIYIEPYAGGSAVALSLLLEGYAWEIIINDIDPMVYAFWWSLLNDTNSLSQKIIDTVLSVEEWKKQKLIYLHPEHHSLTDVGFATFFLNRTNRSGILEGGIIGGKKQDGPFKLDARFKKHDLVERISLIAQYKGRIKLFNEDAIRLIKKISSSLPNKCLIYFDPPYFKKGKLLYKNFYTPSDHAKIARYIRKLKCPWIVTYDNVPEIRELYEGEEQTEFDISYSTYLGRPRGEEIMFHKNLFLPSAPYTRKASHG